MATDELKASWLNGFSLAGGVTVIDRWSQRIPKRPARACTGGPDCLWCRHQLNLKDAGKKHKPLDQCPWRDWEPPAPLSETIPAAERWELVDMKIYGGRRNRHPSTYRHIGFYASREAAEEARKKLGS